VWGRNRAHVPRRAAGGSRRHAAAFRMWAPSSMAVGHGKIGSVRRVVTRGGGLTRCTRNGRKRRTRRDPRTRDAPWRKAFGRGAGSCHGKGRREDDIFQHLVRWFFPQPGHPEEDSPGFTRERVRQSRRGLPPPCRVSQDDRGFNDRRLFCDIATPPALQAQTADGLFASPAAGICVIPPSPTPAPLRRNAFRCIR
jgi:hypothetical protein